MAAVSAVLSARRLDQLKDDLGAAGWELDPAQQMMRLSEASTPPDIYLYGFIQGAQRV